MHWKRGPITLEMINDPQYSFRSADNLRTYRQEYLLDERYRPSSLHGLEVYLNGVLCSSAVLGSSGGGTGVHPHSCIITETQCIVAVGDRIVALSLPDLLMRWQARADEVTCFGLHLSPDGLHVIVHGELAISMFTLDGVLLWAFCGKDIFTGACEVGGDTITVWDFSGEKYRIDIKTGRRAGRTER